jgi:hypothetical protein
MFSLNSMCFEAWKIELLENTAWLVYNVSKGTEYFVSL